MNRKQTGLFETWLRGGQTIGHNFEMTLEVIGKLLLILIAPWTWICAQLASVHVEKDAQLAFLSGIEAWLAKQIGWPIPQSLSIRGPNGDTRILSVDDIMTDPDIHLRAAPYVHSLQNVTIIWACGVFLIYVLSSQWFNHHGREKTKSTHVRGQEVIPFSHLIRQVEEFNFDETHKRKDLSHVPVRLGAMPYPYKTEFEHTVISGSTGAGKSQLISNLLEDIKRRGHKAIVFDPETDYIKYHYDKGTDTILNPFDARSPSWSPFADAVDAPDWNALAAAIFREPTGSADPYWTHSARSVFVSTCLALQQRHSNFVLDDLLNLFFGDPKVFADFLQGTPAHQHVAQFEGPRAGSIKSVLIAGIEPLIYLHGKSRDNFSIRKWVNKPAHPWGEFLFLSAPSDQMATLKPLLGFWTELVIRTLLARKPEEIQPTWIIMDEFHSAGRMDALADSPTRIRKRGGALVLGFQMMSQLAEIYGPDKARTIVGNCGTKVIFRVGDFETAKIMSELLGRRQVHRVEQNTQYGATSVRDGIGLVNKEELEFLFLPEDIMNPPVHHGIMRLNTPRDTGAFPIAKFKGEYTHREFVAEPFVPAQSDPTLRFFIQGIEAAKIEAAGLQTMANVIERAPDFVGRAKPQMPLEFEANHPTQHTPNPGPRVVVDNTRPPPQDEAEEERSTNLKPQADGSTDKTRDIGDKRRSLDDTEEGQAALLRKQRADEEEEARRLARETRDAREPAPRPTDRSVDQKEDLLADDVVATTIDSNAMGAQDHETLGDIHYALKHRGDAMNQAAAIMIQGVIGVEGNIDDFDLSKAGVKDHHHHPDGDPKTDIEEAVRAADRAAGRDTELEDDSDSSDDTETATPDATATRDASARDTSDTAPILQGDSFLAPEDLHSEHRGEVHDLLHHGGLHVNGHGPKVEAAAPPQRATSKSPPTTTT